MTDDPDSTQLRPPELPRPRPSAPAGAWDNVDAWQEPPSTPDPAPEPPLRRDAGPKPSAKGRRIPWGDRRRQIDPEELERRRRDRLVPALGALLVLVVAALLVPTAATPSTDDTARAISVAHGPLPRRAASAELPDTIGDLHRDDDLNSSLLPFGVVDHGVYADKAGARRVQIRTQNAQLTSLEDYDARMGMQAIRLGRVSCGKRFDGLVCSMLLEDGILSLSTMDPSWDPDSLAGVARRAYSELG